MEYKTIITRTGLAKIANATALGEKVNFKYMAFGDGNGDYPELNENMTQLVNEVYRGDINNVEVIDGTNIKISKVIPAHVGGFHIREIGIFDVDKDLIAIGTFPATYKPTINEGATKDVMARMIIRVSNTDAIELKIDPNVIVATLKDLEDLREEIKGLDANFIDEINKNEFSITFRNNIPYFKIEEVKQYE